MNSFREWLSDNLRYIFLIAGVLAVLLGLFFGVREISARMSRDPDAAVLSTANVAAAPGSGDVKTASVTDKSAGATTEAGAEVTADTAADTAASAEGAEVAAAENAASAGTPAAVAAPAAAAEETGSAVETAATSAVEAVAPGAPTGVLAENSVPAVTEVMKEYYDAVGRQDISAIRAIVDELPENTATEIASSDITYSDVRVYTKNGPEAGSYIAYTTYEARGASASTAIPGMSQSYVKTEDDGSLRIVFEALDEETKNYIKAVSEEADVKSLIKEVQTAHDTARKAASAESAAQSYSSDDDDSDDSYDDEDDSSSDDYDEDESYDDSDEDYDDSSSDDYDEDEEEYEEEEEEETEWTGYVPNTVNIRSAPSWDGSVISEIPGGSSVTVFGSDIKGWYHVNYDGIDGYVGHSWID